jgi:hypothetical protein
LEVSALTRDLSSSGLALYMPTSTELKIKGKAHIHLLHNQITLQVIPVYSRQEPEGLVIGFKIGVIERGERDWKSLLDRLQQSRGDDQ